MKVIYYSKFFFADCNFPLIKSLQENGADVRFYMPLNRKFQRGNLIELDEPISRMRFVKASKIKGMEKYKDCLDLDRMYLICGYPDNKFWPASWLFWLFVVLHMIMQRADIIHIDWQLSNPFEKLIYKFRIAPKKIATVHDPIAHSGNRSECDERDRTRLFSWADKLILLNKSQTMEFCKTYKIADDKISYSKLGVYDSIAKVSPIPANQENEYILFFGVINEYKGLEYLLEAMLSVHKYKPNLKLIVAGSGRLYFDATKYQNLDYIEWRNRYIGVAELAGLLKDALFTICPYKDATQSGVIQTAFSLSCPVIATTVGALKEEISHFENGVLIPPCNTEALVESIIQLSDNKFMIEKMKNNIKTCWIAKKSWIPISKDYLDTYRC